jgi:hypothetical protein
VGPRTCLDAVEKRKSSTAGSRTRAVLPVTILTELSRLSYAEALIKYCHAFSDRRRVLDSQLDLLQSYTQVQYN